MTPLSGAGVNSYLFVAKLFGLFYKFRLNRLKFSYFIIKRVGLQFFVGYTVQ